MNYLTQIEKDVLILQLEGDLIGENESQLISELAAYLNEGVVKNCVVDISKIRFINSSGIGILITILTKFRNKGGDVTLMKPSDQVKKLLIITKLNSIFTVVEDKSSAMEQLK